MENLVPADDGACQHLFGLELPDICLKSARGNDVFLRELRGISVFYIFPMSGEDDTLFPVGWDLIPGTSGCSAQSCSFSQNKLHFDDIGATVFGVSSQSPSYLATEINRLELSVDLLSDENKSLQSHLGLPIYSEYTDGRFFFKRVTIVTIGGVIKKVFYPISAPEENAQAVLEWLHTYRATEEHQPSEGKYRSRNRRSTE